MNLREHQLYIQVNRNNAVTSICYKASEKLHRIWLIRTPKRYPSSLASFFFTWWRTASCTDRRMQNMCNLITRAHQIDHSDNLMIALTYRLSGETLARILIQIMPTCGSGSVDFGTSDAGLACAGTATFGSALEGEFSGGVVSSFAAAGSGAIPWTAGSRFGRGSLQPAPHSTPAQPHSSV